MSEDIKDKLTKSVENIKNKTNRIFFMVQDVKGNPRASIRLAYQMAMTLKKGGYNPVILHEKKEYSGVPWLEEDYLSELPHMPVEGSKLEVSPEDIIVIPEIFAFIMEQVKSLPCAKIVLSQAHDHIFETLSPGVTWQQLGFFKVITTSEEQKEYIENLFNGISCDVIEPPISDSFSEKNHFPMPIIGINTREQRDGLNIIKRFYLRYPQFRWITFRDLRGLSEKSFAKAMHQTFLSVWVDKTSSFGTFPLESIKMGKPVIGLIPDMPVAWMNENNGVWVQNQLDIVDRIADFTQNWLEDNIKPELYDELGKTAAALTSKDDFDEKVIAIFDEFTTKRRESFESQISKLTETPKEQLEKQ